MSHSTESSWCATWWRNECLREHPSDFYCAIKTSSECWFLFSWTNLLFLLLKKNWDGFVCWIGWEYRMKKMRTENWWKSGDVDSDFMLFANMAAFKRVCWFSYSLGSGLDIRIRITLNSNSFRSINWDNSDYQQEYHGNFCQNKLNNAPKICKRILMANHGRNSMANCYRNKTINPCLDPENTVLWLKSNTTILSDHRFVNIK